MEHEWHVNTGTVPEGVGSDTVIEVEYRDGVVNTIRYSRDQPSVWKIKDDVNDIIRWRFV